MVIMLTPSARQLLPEIPAITFVPTLVKIKRLPAKMQQLVLMSLYSLVYMCRGFSRVTDDSVYICCAG